MNLWEIAPGVYAGGAPRTQADYQRLQCLGIKTIVDVRDPYPRLAARAECGADAYCLNRVAIPLGYRPMCNNTPELVLQIMTDAEQLPVYIHCNLGRDRAALVVALYRVRYLGWSPETAYNVMRAQRFNPFLRGLDEYFWAYATAAPSAALAAE
jgi:hypothetical protein